MKVKELLEFCSDREVTLYAYDKKEDEWKQLVWMYDTIGTWSEYFNSPDGEDKKKYLNRRIEEFFADGLGDGTGIFLEDESAEDKPTNGDKWRSMTDEQIAEIIQRDGCCCCPCDEKTCEAETQKKLCADEEEFNERCKAAIIKWLKQEYKPKEEGGEQCSNATSAEAK